MSEVLKRESALKSKEDCEVLYVILSRVLKNGKEHASRKY